MRGRRVGTRAVALATCVALVGVTLEPVALAGPPTSDPAARDEVRLTNGGFVRGELVELMPGEYVIIETSGGELRRFEWSQVAEVVRGSTTMPGDATTTTPSDPRPSDPTAFEPTAIEPPSEPEPPNDEREGEGPTLEQPYLHLDVEGEHSMTLYRVLGRSVASSGGYTATGVAYARVCDDPCGVQLDDPNAELFVAGDKYAGSKPFYLKPRASIYELKVKPRRKGMRIGGYILMISGICFGVFMATGPFLVNMRRSQANASYALAAVGGVGMLAGGITLMAFGRSKVEVLPRDESWLESH